MAFNSSGPLLFRLAKFMTRNGIRGGHRLMKWLEDRGALQVIVAYPLSNKVSAHVPLYRPENRWDLEDAQNYEKDVIDSVVKHLSGPTTLIDCGAEIGLFTSLLCSRSSFVSRVIAIEPNENCHKILKLNLGAVSPPTEFIFAAVGSEPGTGSLRKPSQESLEDALFIERGDGGIQIVALDGLNIATSHIVLKLDVEGWESHVLRGAQNLLKSHSFIVAFEANGEVCQRTGIDPIDILKWIPGYASCSITVAEQRDRPIDLNRPFIEQYPEAMTATRNIVVVSP